MKTRSKTVRPVRVGLIGCGAIGTHLAHEIQQRLRGLTRLIGLYDHHIQNAQTLSSRCSPSVPLLTPDQLIQKSDFLIEAASAQAVQEWLPRAIANRLPLMVLSSGGLLKQQRLLKQAQRRGVQILIPSGALAGLDGLKGAAIGKLSSITLTTRKPPPALPGLKGLKKLTKPKLLFSGSPAKAAAAFPQNINIAATLALAAQGRAKIRVRLIADPKIKRNQHTLAVVGEFGQFTAQVENKPSKENPRTSRLAALSAVAALKQEFVPLRVGT